MRVVTRDAGETTLRCRIFGHREVERVTHPSENDVDEYVFNRWCRRAGCGFEERVPESELKAREMLNV